MSDAGQQPPKTASLSAVGAQAFSEADAPPWSRFGLSLSSQGFPHANADNVAKILRQHPSYTRRIWFDSFHNRIRTNLDLDDRERSWSDADEIDLLTFIQGAMQIPRANLAHVQQGVQAIANVD